MHLDVEVRVTTALLWRATALFSIVAAALLLAIGRLVSRQRFATLRSHITGTAFLVWFAIWLAMVSMYWQRVYSYFFFEWLRWPLPLLMATAFGIASRLLWSLASRSRRSPAVVFVLLGGALGPLSHTWAVFRGFVHRPPLLQGVSPVAAIVVSMPEFALYFSAILGLAVLSASVKAGQSRQSAAAEG